MARTSGRQGRPWRRMRAIVLAEETHCFRCGQPVNKELPGTHPLGPTVDHVVPRSKGGSNTDRANMRLAHNRCNAAAGNRTPTRTSTRAW